MEMDNTPIATKEMLAILSAEALGNRLRWLSHCKFNSDSIEAISLELLCRVAIQLENEIR